MFDRSIQYAVAAARYGSFTAAAERVGVTQSAITKSIGDLEQRLGYTVFNRTARGTPLTEEGSIFIDRASRLLDDAKALMRAPSREDPYAAPLRVGVCPASLEWAMIKPIARVMGRHKQIRLDVSSSSFERMAQQLRNGSVDVAVGFEQAFGEQPDFRRVALSALQTTYFTRLGHPILEETRVTNAELAKYDFVAPSISQPYGASIRDIYEGQGVDSASRIHTVDYFPMVQTIVDQTDAIGVVSVDFACSETFKRRFGVIALREAIPPSSLCCATRARLDPLPTVRAFIKACRECLPPARA